MSVKIPFTADCAFVNNGYKISSRMQEILNNSGKQSDWEVTDKGDLAYIKNKPFGEEVDETVLGEIAGVTPRQGSDDLYYIHFTLDRPFDPNANSYVVTRDNINVACTYIPAADAGAYYLIDPSGNRAAYIGPDGLDCTVYGPDPFSSARVKKQYASLVKIPLKYLPDTWYEAENGRGGVHTKMANVTGTYGVAEGYNSDASGNYAHAEGNGTSASGASAHAEGASSAADGMAAHAEGNMTSASGDYAHAEGNQTEATGASAHAEGYKAKATGRYSHAEGNASASADFAHAEGSGTASGVRSHTEGTLTTALGMNAHAEGSTTKANGAQSHAEGDGTTASGLNSHAEGSKSKATGVNSHAEGDNTLASAENVHVEGTNTIASGKDQHVHGRYNIADTEDVYATIVGNGYVSDTGVENPTGVETRSNCHTLDWDGNAWYSGSVTADRGFRFISPNGTEFFLNIADNGGLVVTSGEKVLVSSSYLSAAPSIVYFGTTDHSNAASRATISTEMLPSNTTDTLTWWSSDTSIASVTAGSNGKGIIQAESDGQCYITVTTSSGLNRTVQVIVRTTIPATAIVLNENALSMRIGDTHTLVATLTPANSTDEIAWSSNNTSVATVNQYGVITAVGAGSCKVTATTTSGKTKTVNVTVLPPDVATTGLTLKPASFVLSGINKTRTITPVQTPSDANDTIEWISSDISVATVNSNGVVTSVGAGTCTITALVNGITATASVTVNVNDIPATGITLSKGNVYLGDIGMTEQITATLTPSNSNEVITWESTDESVATVNSTGLITAVGNGECYIIARTSGGLTARIHVVVDTLRLVHKYEMKADTNEPDGNGKIRERLSDLIGTYHLIRTPDNNSGDQYSTFTEYFNPPYAMTDTVGGNIGFGSAGVPSSGSNGYTVILRDVTVDPMSTKYKHFEFGTVNENGSYDVGTKAVPGLKATIASGQTFMKVTISSPSMAKDLELTINGVKTTTHTMAVSADNQNRKLIFYCDNVKVGEADLSSSANMTLKSFGVGYGDWITSSGSRFTGVPGSYVEISDKVLTRADIWTQSTAVQAADVLVRFNKDYFLARYNGSDRTIAYNGSAFRGTPGWWDVEVLLLGENTVSKLTATLDDNLHHFEYVNGETGELKTDYEWNTDLDGINMVTGNAVESYIADDCTINPWAGSYTGDPNSGGSGTRILSGRLYRLRMDVLGATHAYFTSDNGISKMINLYSKRYDQ